MKKSFLLIILYVLLLIFNFTNSSVCFAKDENIIVVGLDIDVPPVGFLDSNGNIVGFDVDLARETFDTVGKKVKFQPINWDAKELELESGRIDVVWNGLTYTEERAKNMLLTKPYMENQQVFLVKSESNINNLEDLKSKTICVQKGSAVETELISSEIGKNAKQIITNSSMLDCLNEVRFGRSDAALIDSVMAKYYLKQNNMSKAFKILSDAFTKECDVIAVKKDNIKLKNEIEEGLSRVIQSGKAKEISERWFGENVLCFGTNNISLEEKAEIKNSIEGQNDIFKGIIDGLFMTLRLFLLSFVFSMTLGFVLCLFRRFNLKFLNILIDLYTVVIRGTPLLLQIFFIFYGVPLLLPVLKMDNRFFVGTIAFIINYAAYFSEIFRGGINSIAIGQWDAIKVLRIPKFKAIRKIILPQALNACLPAVCNETISLVKDTSLIFSIGLVELLTATKNAVNVSANVFIYAIAAIVYLAICFFINILFKFLENKVNYEN